MAPEHVGWDRAVERQKGPPGQPRRPFLNVVLDGAADGAQHLADLAAEEDKGDDREDRDQGEDQRVLRESLALLIANEERRDECVQTSHVLFTSFPDEGPPPRREPRSRKTE